MLEEKMLSGYCRQTDQARMVWVEYEDGQVTDVDCQFGSCPFSAECAIGQQIRKLTEP